MDTINCPKCEHEHQPTGLHEEDEGRWNCESCGFRFVVEIEYTPTYMTYCVEHQLGDYEQRVVDNGDIVVCRFCVHCQACQLKEEPSEVNDG